MKSITLKSSLLFLLLLITFTITAQDHLLEGYIQTHDGETIHGYLDDVFKEGTNPSKIIFRKNMEDPGKEYDPYSIRSFSVNGIVYEGGFVSIELSSRELNTLSNSPELVIEREVAFLQAIVLGEKSLYVYKNTVVDNFYIKNDSVFELLEYKKYFGSRTVIGEPRRVVIENKKYTGQLTIYLTGCPEMSSEIPTTKYNQKALTRLFSKYYNCTKEDFRLFDPKRVALLKAGIIANYSLTSLNYNFTTINAQIGSDATSAYGVGLSLQGRVSPNLFLIGELSFSGPFSHNVEPITYTGQTYSVESSFRYHASSRKGSLLARYQMPVNNFYVFANAGLALDRINGIYQVQQTTTYISGSSYNLKEYRRGFTSYHVLAGVGVKYSHFSLESRIEPSIINKYQGTAINFMIGYTFGNVLP